MWSLTNEIEVYGAMNLLNLLQSYILNLNTKFKRRVPVSKSCFFSFKI